MTNIHNNRYSMLCRDKASLLLWLSLISISSILLCSSTAADEPINQPASDTKSQRQPNILLICIDDLRPELACYGKPYISSPNIDAFAKSACLFERHFVQAPTCGASRYALLTGCYGSTSNQALFDRAKQYRSSKPLQPNSLQPHSLPGWFRKHGYETVAVGKVSHHPGGLGGNDWNDPQIEEMPNEWTRLTMPCGPWQHPRGAMHGLANGEIRNQSSTMDVMQSVAGDDTIYPDGLIVQAAVEELQSLSHGPNPFLLAVGLIRPHLPFGAPAKYMEHYVDVSLPPILHPEKPLGRSTWHNSGEFMQYNRWGRDPRNDPQFADQLRRHYAACVSYIDAQVGLLLEKLTSLSLADNTVVVLWGDHGWHLGERGVWGKHTLFDESLHAPLIIRFPGIENFAGTRCSTVVETIDIMPTLLELADLTLPVPLHGKSLIPKLRQPTSNDGQAVAYWGGKQKILTLRTDDYRLVRHPDGFCELYDYRKNQTGQLNIAKQHPAIVESLNHQLRSKLESAAQLPLR